MVTVAISKIFGAGENMGQLWAFLEDVILLKTTPKLHQPLIQDQEITKEHRAASRALKASFGLTCLS